MKCLSLVTKDIKCLIKKMKGKFFKRKKNKYSRK